LGTPDEDVWPGVTTLPDYKSTFPNWHPKELGDHVNGSTDESVELLVVRLQISSLSPSSCCLPFETRGLGKTNSVLVVFSCRVCSLMIRQRGCLRKLHFNVITSSVLEKPKSIAQLPLSSTRPIISQTFAFLFFVFPPSTP